MVTKYNAPRISCPREGALPLKLTIRALLFCFLLIGICSSSLLAQGLQQNRYFYDDLGQLVKVVDSTGTVIEYVYDPVGNMLQIKRSTVGTELAIFAFTPQRGNIGQTVTIQGQGFSTTPTANNVQFNGTAAQVISAGANTIVAAVPAGATTGLISVTVGTQTATSSTNFTIVPAPVITLLSRKSALLGVTAPNFTASGFNFTGASFAFAPALSPPAISLSSPLIDSFGTSASMSLATGPTQAGTFALVGTNASGSSTAGVTPTNRFTVVDPRSTADSDGDGVPDVVEATFGSDPLDAGSVPVITHTPEAESLTFSVLNGAAPPHQTPTPMEAESLTFSLLNGTAPPLVGTNTHEADSLTISLLNGSAPSISPTVFEVDSLTFSVQNTATTAVNTKTQPQTIKVAQSKSNSKQKKSTPENTREEPPQPAETQRTGGANEMRR
jgi:YD repeat-containing protein